MAERSSESPRPVAAGTGPPMDAAGLLATTWAMPASRFMAHGTPTA
jgi:hypothetical protein